MKKTVAFIVLSLLLGFGIGFISGKEYQIYQFKNAISEAFKSPNTPIVPTIESTVSSPLPTPTPNFIIKNIGDEVTLSTMKIKAISSEEKQVIQTMMNQPKAAQKDTKFVLVKISATNITNASFAFPSEVPLIDGNNRIYNTNPIEFSNSDSIVYRNMPPSIAQTGYLIYNVPTDATSYSLAMGKEDTGEYYKITLK